MAWLISNPPLLPSVSLPALVFPMLARCTLWNANNPWILLANPSVAASPDAHPYLHQLFPSWQGGWPSRGLDLYEPVSALFEQMGPWLYQLWLLQSFFWGKKNTLGLSLFFLCKNQRDGRAEMPAIPVGYVVRVILGELCAHGCLSTRRKLDASGVGCWWKLP